MFNARIPQILLVVWGLAFVQAYAATFPDGVDDIYVADDRISVVFSRPMVAIGDNVRAQAELSIDTSPEIPCAWSWHGDRRLLCLATRTELVPATAYRIQIPAMTSLDGETIPPFDHHFETERPQVNTGVSRWESPTEPYVYARSKLNLKTESLRQHIYLAHPETGRRITMVPEIVSPQGRDTGRFYWRLRLTEPLEPGQSYRLHVDPGLVADEGPLPSQRTYVRHISTWDKPRYLGAFCRDQLSYRFSGDSYSTYPALPPVLPSSQPCDLRDGVSLLFTSPLGADGIVALRRAWPDVDLISTGSRSITALANGGRGPRLASVTLRVKKARTRYALAWPEDLTDQFGRTFEPVPEIVFESGDHPPEFRLGQYFGVLAAGSEADVYVAGRNADIYVAERNVETIIWTAVTSNGDRHGEINVDQFMQHDNTWRYVPLHADQKLGLHGGLLEWGQPKWINKQVVATPFNLTVLQNAHFDKQSRQWLALVWVSDIYSNKPVKGAEVGIVSPNDVARVFDADWVRPPVKTDRRGLAFVSLEPPERYAPLWLRARKGKDIALSKFPGWRGYIGPYPFKKQSYLADRRWAVWGITDKPLYQPGETVNFKLFLRYRDDMDLRVSLDDRNWEVRVVDQRGNELFTEPVTFNQHGATAATFTIPANQPNTRLGIGIYDGEGYSYGAAGIQVATYQPSSLEVELKPMAETAVVGDSFPLRIQTSYRAGGAYGDADISVFAVYARGAAEFVNYQKFAFVPPANPNRPNVTESKFIGQFRLDRDGEFKGSVRINSLPFFGTTSLQAVVYQDNGVPAVSNSISIKTVPGQVLVGMKAPSRWVIGTNNIHLIALDPDGVPITDVRMSVTINQPLSSAEDSVTVCTVTSAELPVSCQLNFERTGSYIVVLEHHSAQVDGGRGVRHPIYVYPAEQAVSGPNTRAASVTTDKTQYAIGEVAKVELKSPYASSRVLLTRSRNQLLDTRIVRMSRRTKSIKLRIRAEHAPGFSLGALFLPGDLEDAFEEWGEYLTQRDTPPAPVEAHYGGHYAALAGVDIDVVDPRLAPVFRLNTDSEVYQPGDTITLTLQGSGEVAVTVVDTAVLDLVEPKFDPSPFQYYRPEEWQPSVPWTLAASILTPRRFYPYWPHPDALKKAELKRNRDFDGSALLTVGNYGSAPPSLPRIRHATIDTAYWNPTINIDGTHSVTFNAPDRLTQWQVFGWLANRDEPIVHASSTFRTVLPLRIATSAPRAVLPSDNATATAVVVNHSDASVDANITLTVEHDGVPINAVSKETKLAIGERDHLRLRLGRSRVTLENVGTVTAGSLSDGSAVTTTIIDPVVERSETHLGIADPQTELHVSAPGYALNTARLEIHASASLIGDVQKILDYIDDYPHRVADYYIGQAAIATMLPALKLRSTGWDAAARASILGSSWSQFQTERGLLRPFAGSEHRGDIDTSVFAALTIRWIRAAGVGFPSKSIERLEYALIQELRDTHDAKAADRPARLSADAYVAVLHAVSGHKEIRSEYVDHAESLVNALSVKGKAHLILGLVLNDRKTAASEIAARLRSGLGESRTQVEFEGVQSALTRCLVASGLAAVDHADAPFLARLYRGTLVDGDHGVGFGGIAANAYCLHSYLTTLGPTDDTEVDIYIQGGEHDSLEISKTGQTVRIETVKGNRAYLDATLAYQVDLRTKPAEERGIRIERSYAAYRDGDWVKLDNESVKSGAVIRIRLTLRSPFRRRFVAVTDSLPAGWRVIDPNLATNAPAFVHEAARAYTPFRIRSLSGQRKRFYAEHLSPGTFNLDYFATAEFPGTYTALPAEVELIRAPSVYASSVANRIQVTSE